MKFIVNYEESLRISVEKSVQNVNSLPCESKFDHELLINSINNCLEYHGMSKDNPIGFCSESLRDESFLG